MINGFWCFWAHNSLDYIMLYAPYSNNSDGNKYFKLKLIRHQILFSRWNSFNRMRIFTRFWINVCLQFLYSIIRF